MRSQIGRNGENCERIELGKEKSSSDGVIEFI